MRAEKRDRDAEREKETFRRPRHHQSLLRPYTFFSRSPLVFKTLFGDECRFIMYVVDL